MSERLFILSKGKHQRANVWEKKALTLTEVYQLFEIHVARSEKDGPAFVAGAIMGAERKAVAVERLSFVVFDIDGTQKLDDILKLVEDSGKYALVYTTYSHMKTTEFVKTDSYSKWAGRKKQPPKHTTESVLAYLRDNDKGYLTNVVVSDKPEHTNEGVAIRVTHDPVDKVRIVFPLARDFVMGESGGYTTAEQIHAWKQTYAGIGQALGFDFDKACLDPSRLHFLPAHKEGAPHLFKAYTDRPLMEYSDYQKVALEKIAPAASVQTVGVDGSIGSYGEGGASFNGVPLDDWVRLHSHGTGHRILEVLSQTDSNPADPRIRGERGSGKDGVHIQCPFEDEHSTTGGLGTFFDPGPPNNFERVPTIRCMHSHCQGRRTEDFLAKMLIDGWFPYATLPHAREIVGLERDEMTTSVAMKVREFEAALQVKNEELLDLNKDQTPEQRLVVEALSELIEKGTQFLQEFLKELDTVQYLDSFDRVYGAAVLQNWIIDEPATKIYALGLSPIGIPSLRLYYRHNAAKLLISYHDYTELIRKMREKLRPLPAAIDAMVLKRLVNTERRQAITDIANYYGLAPREITLRVKDAEEHTGSITQQELQRRTDALFGHYVVYSDKTQLWFLDPSTNDADGRRAHRIFTKGVLAQRYSNLYYEYNTDNGRKRIELFEWWIKNRRDVKYLDEVAFRPDKPPNDAPDANPMLYNLYEGMHSVKAVPGDASPFYNHILKAWCGEDTVKADWIVTWFADIVQNPGNRPASALVVHGGQGTGKSIIFDHCLSHVLAPYAVTSNRRDDITGRFNTILKTTLLFVAEEAVFAGDPQAAAKIKSYVSSDTFTLEGKGQDVSKAKLFSRFAFLTNDFHAMRMDGDDRRYCVIETSNEYKQKTDYFQKLREWFENGGNEIVFHFLKTWKPEEHNLTWASLYTAPNDADKARQKRLSVGPVAVIVTDLMNTGNVINRTGTTVFADNWELDDEFKISINQFRQACVNLVESMGSRLFQARVELEERLALCAGYASISQMPRSSVKGQNGKVEACYVFPPRKVCVQRAYQLGMVTAEECTTTTGEALSELDLTSHLRGALAKHIARTEQIEGVVDESAA
ncbi:MAG: hypothetical protein E6R03_16230 [Hyphomicrobiaceae bacterium]|nr:MAG: hypothetical protein E6R03_16230 [Hyphomicrobiaceae bacterium]